MGNPLSLTATGAFVGVGGAGAGTQTLSFTHDLLDRLTAEPGQAYAYDPNGNRLSDAAGSYSVLASSNRLSSSPAGPITLDAAGNTTAIAQRSFSYNDAGRLVQARQGAAVLGSYVYRADQLRAAKTTATGTTLFHWDPAGHLLAETDTSGHVIREVVWAGDTPAVVWSGSGPAAPAFIHVDHLGTPRLATGPAGIALWRWSSSAFGVGAATALNGSGLVIPLRMPGQFLDDETGLFQNWHRAYDPASGRYLESDPIGLGGGINTFAYVQGNPAGLVDPDGRLALNAGLAGLGAVIGGLSGAIGTWQKCGSWQEIAAAGAAGALFGATAGATLGFGGSIGVGAAAGFGGDLAGTLLGGGGDQSYRFGFCWFYGGLGWRHGSRAR